jgi:sterol desaturase/sphingolipid hydroxylase (fatty acid hydroxylase superfamily)
MHAALAFILFSSSAVQAMTRMGAAYGYFDDTAARNNVPDAQSWRVLGGVAATLLVRPLLGVAVVYRQGAPAAELSLLLPLQLFVYSCVLDAWYYAYHRAMHEVPWLWRFHRLHHVAKHPTVLLSPFADGEQELMDILVMPLLAWACFPVNFPTWHVCQCFVVFTELAGHSGVRLHWAAPMTGAVLRAFGLELVVEDHDMHHRHGWRTSANVSGTARSVTRSLTPPQYGKQTRIYDTLFGTTRPRAEGTDEHVDWARAVPML